MSDTEDQLSKKERKELKRLLKELKKELKELKKESKKRSLEELEEISIDLAEPAPLSKKQKRLIRQGKLDEEKLLKKNKIPKPLVNSDGEDESTKVAKPKEKSEFGVWVGNLSFDTTKEDLKRFLVAKTSELPEYTESMSLEELVKIEEEDVTRVNLPKRDENKIKGFAYIDFKLINHVFTAISLSEQYLNGRNLLIKNANSFEGRPKKDPVLSLSKNPPSRILFVGNLSFDTSKELLEEHFQSCGEIIKIRMATFEDSGKCKGFAFVDFKDEKGPTAALSSKIYKKLINRPLRLEFGEDRSKRTPIRRIRDNEETSDSTLLPPLVTQQPRPTFAARERVSEEPQVRLPRPPQQRNNNVNTDMGNNQRLKSSVLLATAQRASAAIVKSTGKKIKF